MSGKKLIPLEQRIIPKINKGNEDECWEWKGAKYKFGYGQIRIGGINRKYATAHRVIWEIAYSPIPERLKVLHKCDNPKCCNPNHLFLGTQSDNVTDMINKGRDNLQRFGNKHAAKWTWEQVNEMRKFYSEGMPKNEIANKFQINRHYLNDILMFRRWR